MPFSVIRSFDYYAVRSSSERRYAYLDVPAKTCRSLRLAPSAGVFFNAEIRDRFDLVTGERE